jgi:hypothetical protein
MSESATSSAPRGYDINFKTLIRVISARRKLVFSCMGATLLLAIVYLHVALHTYTATFMVSPIPSSSDGLSSKLQGMGALASLAGARLNLDSGSQSFLLYQQAIYSRDVANVLSRNPVVMHRLFAGQWDAETQQWKRPNGPLRSVSGAIKSVIGIPVRPWLPPDGAALQEYIQHNVGVVADPEKPVVVITYDNVDPAFAVFLLTELDRAVDAKLRKIALLRATEYVDYLSTQLMQVTNSDVRQALINTLTEQERIKMMVNATAPYAAQPFGPPSASRAPTKPKPSLVLFIAILVGGLLGALCALTLPDLGSIGWPRFLGRGVHRPAEYN